MFVTFYSDKIKKVITLDTCKLRLRRMRNRVSNWVKIVEKINVFNQYYMIMVTLTYRENDWEPNDIRKFMRTVKRKLKKGLVAYCWVCEMQKRGVPHYHVLLVVRNGYKLGKPDEEGMWSKGMTRVERARSPWYVCKYLSKDCIGNEYPKGCRMFAVFIMGDDEKYDLRYLSMNKIQREFIDLYGDDWKEYYGFYKRENGWKLYSIKKKEENSEKDRNYIVRLLAKGYN